MRRLKSPDQHKKLINTISYFSYFGFAPSFEEISAFFPERITEKQLKSLTVRLHKQKKVIKQEAKLILFDQKDRRLSFKTLNSSLYTLPQYSIHIKNRLSRQHISEIKLNHLKTYIKTLSLMPAVQMVAISGSSSMLNCKPSDDVDLFIISQEKAMFLVRFWAIILAHLFRIRKEPTVVCLNLFMSEDNLAVPVQKQNEYIAHEILQLKPVTNKHQAYERFIQSNKWVYRLFPNSKRTHVKTINRSHLFILLFYPLELLLKLIQLKIINRNKTGFLISPTQLWLFKKDFQSRLKKLI